jgi:cytochrome c oxidase subunit II
MVADVRSKPFLPVAAVVVLLTVADTALAANGGFLPSEPESPNAERVNDAYVFVSIFALFVFVLVEGVLLAFVLKYRRRRRARDAEGAQVHGSTRLELMWTVVPVVILVAIGTFVFYKLPGIADVPAASATRERLDVRVVGRQFYWQFEYRNGAIAVDRMRVPEGRVIRLEITAPPHDVIHSWWQPAFGGKFDAIPGQVNVTWFEPERTGLFRGRCGELCGLKHAQMLADVEVLPVAEFEAWVDQRAEGLESDAEFGEELYVGVCAKCHGPQGQGGYGPAIADSTLATDARAVERLLRNGRGAMPPVGRGWNDRQMEAMTGYLRGRFGNGD